MNNKNGSFGPIIKSLLITSIKLIGISLAFSFKMAGLIFTKTGELFEKLSSNGSHH